MTLLDQFLAVIDAHQAASGWADSTLSVHVCKDRGSITELRSGKRDQTTRSHERRLQWLSDNWPEGAVWPASVARPAPSVAETEAA